MALHNEIMKITQVDGPSKGYFRAEEAEKEAGRMTYSWAGGDKFIIDHTEVDPAFKGRNVGKSLVEEAVLFARKSGAKIMPLCPFAKSVFEKREDLRDVLI